jgi:hypothetical protein
MILDKNNEQKILIDIDDLSPNSIKFLKSLLKRNGKPAPFCDGSAFCYDCIVGFKILNQLNHTAVIIKDNNGRFIREHELKLIDIKNNGVILSNYGYILAKKIQHFHI